MKVDILAHVAEPLPRAGGGVSLADLDQRIETATEALLGERRGDGHWCFELEGDATVPAEYILFRYFRGEPEDLALEARFAAYLRRVQGAHGGWPLFHDGALDISASVKAYFALKMIGDSPDASHMRRAREAILVHGGAARSNVFTRCLMALYGEVPWRAVPSMPVEITLLPRWFPFHLEKISYWARTTLVPLLVLQALRPRAKNSRGVNIQELFVVPPEQVRRWPKGPHQKAPWAQLFAALDAVLKAVEPFFPRRSRRRAIDKAVAFVDERLNGLDGIGAIFPPMIYSVLMYDALGIPSSDPRVVAAREAIEKLLVIKEDEAYCQPCLSPVWDTALACHALLEVGSEAAEHAVGAGLDWLKPRQVLDLHGDWAAQRPNVRPGGWAFQYANDHYPDLDDTALVVMAMDRARARLRLATGDKFDSSIARGREWIDGLQGSDGGWAAFDADNTSHYLNNIPFSDHGALLDPPTADLTARCVSMLAQLDAEGPTSPALAAGVEWLLKDQREDGSWFGRWGMNYIYGTWSALSALNAAGVDSSSSTVRKGVAWLFAIQNEDGGWGEDGSSYKLNYRGYEPTPSTPTQTAWALLGLMAAGEVANPAVERGVDYLARNQSKNGLWSEERYNAVGFPRVFYLRYHGYPRFFPLWALARYRSLKRGNARIVAFGV
jgi:squalene-hopene/tetraprenyl-beta-curcumene cyclase